MVASSNDLGQRMARIEKGIAASACNVDSVRSMIQVGGDDVSVLTPLPSRAPESNDNNDSSLSQFEPAVESEILTSRVYSRVIQRYSSLSFSSETGSSIGMSFLSGISLRQISSISAISLPVFSEEIYNSRNFQMSNRASLPDSTYEKREEVKMMANTVRNPSRILPAQDFLTSADYLRVLKRKWRRKGLAGVTCWDTNIHLHGKWTRMRESLDGPRANKLLLQALDTQANAQS